MKKFPASLQKTNGGLLLDRGKGGVKGIKKEGEGIFNGTQLTPFNKMVYLWLGKKDSYKEWKKEEGSHG